MRGLTGKEIAIGKAPLALLALAAASVACLPAPAVAAPRTIPPSGTIEGRPVHSGEGASGTAARALPLRVADAAAYAREKQRAGWRKLGEGMIQTVRGVGYRVPEEPAA